MGSRNYTTDNGVSGAGKCQQIDICEIILLCTASMLPFCSGLLFACILAIRFGVFCCHCLFQSQIKLSELLFFSYLCHRMGHLWWKRNIFRTAHWFLSFIGLTVSLFFLTCSVILAFGCLVGDASIPVQRNYFSLCVRMVFEY